MQKMLRFAGKVSRELSTLSPAILRENVAEWFELDVDSPYITLEDAFRCFKGNDIELLVVGKISTTQGGAKSVPETGSQG